MKKILSLLLAALMVMGLVVTFSSCKKEETPKETIDNFVVANGKDNACTIVYAYGNDGKHRTRRSYAESMATFIFQQCGVKPAVEDDREAEGDGYEILLGDTNRAATATVKAEITGTLTYIVRAVDKKLVIVAGSDLALSEAVSTFINTTKQLNYKVSKKDNDMSFKNGYNYTITLPAAVTNVKDLGYIATALEATITKDNKQYQHFVVQGGTTDGKYLYACLEDQKANSGDDEYYYHTENHTTVIVKIEIATMKMVAKSDMLYLDHSNDMAYNSKTNELVVVHCGMNKEKPERSRILSFIDPDTLTIKRTCENAFEGGYAATYNANKDIFVAAGGGGYKYYNGNYQNADGSYRNRLTRYDDTTYSSFTTGHTTQGIDCDDDYIYAVLTGDGEDGVNDSGFGYLVISTWEGKLVTICRIPLPEGESQEIETENICHVGNTFYVMYNARSGSSIGHIHSFTIEGLSH